jgi:ABC-type uncharacterized transport system auxiliary subunit
MSTSHNTTRISEILRPSGRLESVRRPSLAGLALLALSVAGCGSSKPVHYFQLTHPPTTAIASAQAPLDATILVRLFQTSHLYREDRIVYGNENVEVGLYENDRWTEPPVELLQDAMARGLRSSGAFRAVTTLRSDANVDYYLTGQLYSFREVSGSGIVARLSYDVELMDLKKGKTIWKHSYNHDEPSGGKSVSDLVMAMDKNVHQSVQEAQDGIVQALTEYTRK